MIELRPYQNLAVEGLRQGLRDGHRCQILCSPTGSGKTVIGAYLLQEVQAKERKAAFVVDRVALCAQTSRTLWDYGIQHGIAQGKNSFGRHESIQVCSSQTIEKRGFLPDLDLMIVDEAHTQRKFIVEFAQRSKIPIIGLTATPFSKGLGETYSNVVNVTTTDELIAQKYLAPLVAYAATEIDMTGAKVVAGEWTDREVEERGRAIIGDIVKEWVEKTNLHFGGPVKTIGFSATVAHGEEICREFQAAGYDFRQISYKDRDDDYRADLIQQFRDGEIMGLVSCEALAKGFDVPDVLCLISARPYRKSFSSHIQQIGRAMRSSPGKDYALLLDHCLASGSQVLTDRGLVPIENVQLSDLLWDGNEWVSHGGVVSKGVQECITYAGLTATADHRVKTRCGWMAFGEVAEKQIPITQTGSGGERIWERENRFAGGGMAGPQKQQSDARPLRMRDVWSSVNHFILKLIRRADEGLSFLQSTEVVPGLALPEMCGDAGPMQVPIGLQLGPVWRERDRVSVRVPESGRVMDYREFGSARTRQGHTVGPDQQRRALRTGEHPLGHAASESCEYTDISMDAKDARFPVGISGSRIRRRYAAPIDDGRDDRHSNHREIPPTIQKTKRQVWDIQNAGPRNCFTCEGLLVHNCGNYLGFLDRMDEFFANGVHTLDDGSRDNKVREEVVKEQSDIVCVCGYVLKPSMDTCPSCGAERKRKSKVETRPGIMVEIERGKEKPTKPYLRDPLVAWGGICHIALLRKKGDIEAAKKFALAQYRNFYDEWPDRGWVFDPAEFVDPGLASHIKANLIRYAKRRAA